MKRLQRVCGSHVCALGYRYAAAATNLGPFVVVSNAVRCTSSRVAVSTQLNDMFDSFAEARELIRDAVESAGTVYFHDDIEDAEAMTAQTLKQWQNVQDTLQQSGDTTTLERLVKENELKMKQLQAELEEAKHASV